MEATRQKDAPASREELVIVRRIEPEVLDDAWDLILVALDAGVPERDEAVEARVRKALENNLMQAHLILDAGPKKALLGVSLVQPGVDWMTGKTNLQIFSLYTAAGLTLSQYRAAFKWMERIAKDLECDTISAVSDKPELIKMVKMLGADTSTTMIRFNVGD